MARGRQFAADNGNQSVRCNPDLMVTLHLNGFTARGTDKRAATSDTSHHIFRTQIRFQRRVCAFQQKVQFSAIAVNIVQIALIVFIRGAQIGDVAPARNGRAPTASGHRNGHRAIIANFHPRDGDMNPLRRTDIQRR